MRGLTGPSPSGEPTPFVLTDARGDPLAVGDRVAHYVTGRVGVVVDIVRQRVRIRWADRSYAKQHASKANQADLIKVR